MTKSKKKKLVLWLVIVGLCAAGLYGLKLLYFGGTWGPAVNGIQMRLVSQRLVCWDGRRTKLMIQFRNVGLETRTLRINHRDVTVIESYGRGGEEGADHIGLWLEGSETVTLKPGGISEVYPIEDNEFGHGAFGAGLYSFQANGSRVARIFVFKGAGMSLVWRLLWIALGGMFVVAVLICFKSTF